MDALDLCLFQFTPLREGRPDIVSRYRRYGTYFNSRPCERGDPILRSDQDRKQISIHAPARGATHKYYFASIFAADFNSRPCERGDSGALPQPPQGSKFQFTPLREGRRGGSTSRQKPCYFNSRPCERGDGSDHSYCYRTSYFNSRPCERGDQSSKAFIITSSKFQFTPLREGRQQNQTKYALFFSAIIEKNS